MGAAAYSRAEISQLVLFPSARAVVRDEAGKRIEVPIQRDEVQKQNRLDECRCFIVLFCANGWLLKVQSDWPLHVH